MKSIKTFFFRLKRLWELSSQYDKNRESDSAYFQGEINTLGDRIGGHTIVHADIHWHNPHQIIVIGSYQNRDYVRVFNLEADDWKSLVNMLHTIERNAKVGRIDVPHSMPFSVVYERDRF